MSETILVKASSTFKEAVATYAAMHNKTLSELVRETLAAAIGYDLSADDNMDTRGRPKQYASDEARKKASNERARDKAKHQKAVVEAVMRQERLEGAEALEKWLTDRGISLD